MDRLRFFVLGANAKSVARHPFAGTAREPSVKWPDAVGRLWATDSAAAELDPLLVGFLDDETPPPTSVETFTPPSLHSVSSPAYGRAYTVDTEAPGQGPYRPRHRSGESDSGSASGGWSCKRPGGRRTW